jgi:hypothetical protein
MLPEVVNVVIDSHEVKLTSVTLISLVPSDRPVTRGRFTYLAKSTFKSSPCHATHKQFLQNPFKVSSKLPLDEVLLLVFNLLSADNFPIS